MGMECIHSISGIIQIYFKWDKSPCERSANTYRSLYRRKLEYTNYNLLKSLTKNLFLTLKVILAIHYEALKTVF
ncbi:MAG: hypothetical protein CM15mP73_2180 [Hyphomicrobiales bacterium]|nr:MAG: hypothetical protein CM15mP73_2180 [Hyphomicrobiales bacterium]